MTNQCLPCAGVLQSLNYNGTTPATKSKAHDLIRNIKKQQRINYLRAKGQRAGTCPQLLERIIQMVQDRGF